MKFEDAALQSTFLEHINNSGINYKINKSGAIVFEKKDAASIVKAAHQVRDAQFPWYFLKWKTEKEATRFHNVLNEAKIPFFVEQHEDGTWFLLRRADRAIHYRLWPKALESAKKRRKT